MDVETGESTHPDKRSDPTGPDKQKRPYSVKNNGLFSGRGAGTRTLDPLIKSQLLYQLSYTPRVLKLGAGEGTRTLDNHLGKVALYQLSYTRLKRGKTITAHGCLMQLDS